MLSGCRIKMEQLNILLFPTRFFPAISGGDFLLERLGREFLRISRRSSKKSTLEIKIQVSVITSTAIDFASLHGHGRTIDTSHKYFSQYKNLKIHRYRVLNSDSHPSNKKYEKNIYSMLFELTKQYLNLDENDLKDVIKNGPILPEFIYDLFHEQFENSLKFVPNIIHCTYLPYLNIIYSLLIAQYYKIPSCITPFLHFANIRYQKPIFYQILKIFDCIFACTKYEKDVLISNGIDKNKIEILPMGVDAKRFNQDDYRPHFINIYQPKSPVILFCGYKNYEKGALTLLKSIPLLIQKIHQFSVVFIGPSTTAFNYQLVEIKKKAINIKIINISPGNLTGMYDKKKIGAFQLADVYCMPSRSDAYGIAYLEAWATKTPVIAANIPAMHEVVSINRDGLLVEFDNIDQLAKTIIKILQNSSLKKNMGELGYNKVILNNNWTKISELTLKKYHELIHSKNSNNL